MSWTTVLPAIASFLAGPAGGLAAAGVTFLAEKLGAKEATVDSIKETLQGWTPEQLLEGKRIDIEFQKFAMDNGIKIDLAQIKVNEEQAKSTNWFVAGPRPYIMWICGTAFAYATILEPIMRFVAKVIFGYTGEFPLIDTQLTLQVMLGLLGLGWMRTREKEKGVEGNR